MVNPDYVLAPRIAFLLRPDRSTDRLLGPPTRTETRTARDCVGGQSAGGDLGRGRTARSGAQHTRDRFAGAAHAPLDLVTPTRDKSSISARGR